MRHERELLVRPWLPCPELAQREDEENNGWNRRRFRRMRAEIAVFPDGDVLGVTVYKPSGEPEARYWTSKTQHGLDVFRKDRYNYSHEREPGRMYGGMLDSDRHIVTTYGGESLYGYDNEERLVLDYVGGGRDFDEALCRYQMQQTERRRERKKDKIRDEIRKRFAGVEPPPEAFLQWCRDVLMAGNRYLWFEEAGKRETAALCSHCGETVTVRRPYKEHGEGVCPACGSHCTYRSGKKMARKYGESYEAEAASMEAWGETEILIRCYKVLLEFRGGLKGKGPPIGRLSLWEETRRYVNRTDGSSTAYYTRIPCGVTLDGFGAQPIYYGGKMARLWPEGIQEIRAGTPLRYIPIEELEGVTLEVDYVWKRAAERPVVEYLIKMGLHNLAGYLLRAEVTNRVSTVMELNGRTPAELLRVDKTDVRTLVDADPGAEALLIYRVLKKCGVRVDAEQLRQIDEMGLQHAHAAALCNMARRSSLGKALRYIRSQGENENRSCGRWQDYIDMAERLGKDTSNGMIAFPRDLDKAHDEAQKAVKLLDDAETDRSICRRAAKLAVWQWEFNGLCIRPAHSCAELRAEGEALSHCVGRASYAEKMAAGRTAIFFIRKKDEEETPYATLEIDLTTKRVIQCYGERDRYPGDRVKEFYKKWEERVVNGPQRDGKPAPYTRKATERRSA